VKTPVVPDGAEPAWHLYVVTHPRADELIAGLASRAIQARGYYRTPLHRQPAMAPYVDGSLTLPVTDELARTNLALPMTPVPVPGVADEVVAALAALKA
jgi:dTDP-3-amino-3,4,6-trideoxy-alpha-D-glucose transaminase